MPVGGGSPGLQGVLQLPLEPLHQPVRLKVVSSGVVGEWLTSGHWDVLSITVNK
jgi:hypothetical protein